MCISYICIMFITTNAIIIKVNVFLVLYQYQAVIEEHKN